jgi:hypothetical protein
MRRINWKSCLAVAALAITSVVAVAQDHTEQPQGMPPMGPPDEMKMCAGMAGVWDGVLKFQMAPTDTTWMESPTVVTLAYILGGAAMEMKYEGTMMGMPFHGYGIEAYDRESKQWQMTWIDNMAARISFYNGVRTKDGSVYSGQEKMMGQEYIGRITVSNATATSFDWMGENSMDGGKTWWVWGTAKYTKRK